MNEIKRLQQLAGILTEIKVNNPNIIPLKDIKEGEIYTFHFNNGYKENIIRGEVLQIDEDPLAYENSPVRIKIDIGDDEYEEIYDSEITKILK